MCAFKHWMMLVDRLLEKQLGVTHADLPDMPWYDWFEEESLRPFEVLHYVKEALK